MYVEKPQLKISNNCQITAYFEYETKAARIILIARLSKILKTKLSSETAIAK